MIYLDIETDGLAPTVIHCVGVAVDDNDPFVFTDQRAFRRFMSTVSDKTIVAHNGFGFDYPVLERLWNVSFAGWERHDTYIMSMLENPNRDGGHSLSAWGDRLCFPKTEHSDWSAFSKQMAEYCLNDVDLLRCLYKRLRSDLSDFGTSVGAEHRVAAIVAQGTSEGFLLDRPKAERLWLTLTQRMNQIETGLQQTFPPIVTGRVSEKTGKKLKDNVEVFNVGSRQQIAKRLESLGAVFNETTETGQAKVDETTLAAIALPEAQMVAEYLMLQKRVGLVNSWIEACHDDGRVRGRIKTIGAVTGRMTHSSPNMAQIPSVKSAYGTECRECWTVPEDSVLVGIDAKGLELRMLAHYINDADFTAQVVDGDPHSHNQQLAGLPTRDNAKTFIYAFLYGAGDAKIGKIVNGSAQAGAKLRKRFLESLPSLDSLVRDVQKQSRQGWLRGLDGRRIHVRSEHSALNTLLQGAGAIVMKWWLIEFHDRLVAAKIPFKFVANVHDEVQIETPEYYGTFVAKIGLRCFKAATEQLGLNCPLEGDAKIGRNWAETH
jgi:DNA polymerase I-like protein with 3'-5' exonuclease and polymerase domains